MHFLINRSKSGHWNHFLAYSVVFQSDRQYHFHYKKTLWNVTCQLIWFSIYFRCLGRLEMLCGCVVKYCHRFCRLFSNCIVVHFIYEHDAVAEWFIFQAADMNVSGSISRRRDPETGHHHCALKQSAFCCSTRFSYQCIWIWFALY